MPQLKEVKVDLIRASNKVENPIEYLDILGWNNKKYKLSISYLSFIETSETSAEFKHKKMLRSALYHQDFIKYKDGAVKKTQNFNKFVHKKLSVCREFKIQDLKLRFYDAFKYSATDRVDNNT